MRVSRATAIDIGIALALVAASLFAGSHRFVPTGETSQKLVAAFGSAGAWHAYVWWWWLTSIPAVVALLVRRIWPVTALVLAGASVVAHLVDPTSRAAAPGYLTDDLGLLPLDLAAVV